MQSTTNHIPFERRQSTHPLSAYLLRLMLVKRSNLCLSADVSSTHTLLHLADTLGPSIVLLKTHYDIISDWDSNPRTGTGAQLAALARQHGFLIFEDRKFSDIGSTVQKQYNAGPGGIVEWAHITNAHILPGAAIIAALREAANQWREKKRCAVKTDITAGSPGPESEVPEADAPTKHDQAIGHRTSNLSRKSSIVSVTTVSQHFEDANASRLHSIDDEAFPGIEEAPLERGLLLLAQMSSIGNLLDEKYTQTCVEIARHNRDFVIGYIAQESLNVTPEDQFITMSPGCQLPPEDNEDVQGDGMGQQYNLPNKLVGTLGADVIIVGRGIIKAADPVLEAERYRLHGWEAYETRISRS
ncbi:MAG: orotidine 5'-phosphate decarboxylase [Claussenomyces sp. TS43310]|nr:MAG: orotidine 5'-phosphate decarboxylase [Claussenomyces sp. TS43310]